MSLTSTATHRQVCEWFAADGVLAKYAQDIGKQTHLTGTLLFRTAAKSEAKLEELLTDKREGFALSMIAASHAVPLILSAMVREASDKSERPKSATASFAAQPPRGAVSPVCASTPRAPASAPMQPQVWWKPQAPRHPFQAKLIGDSPGETLFRANPRVKYAVGAAPREWTTFREAVQMSTSQKGSLQIYKSPKMAGEKVRLCDLVSYSFS